MAANLLDLPFYVLLSQSNLPSASGTTPAAASSSSTANLVHPVIQYHFADDNPHDILPKHEGELVVIMDYEPGSPTPLVESASRNLAITGVKVIDAPPSGVSSDREPPKKDNMFIIETIGGHGDEGPASDTVSEPRAILAQFRERNATLKHVLDRPSLARMGEAAGKPVINGT